MTVEEIRARAAEIARGLDALDNMGDEEEQRHTMSALIKAIDEEPLSSVQHFGQALISSGPGESCCARNPTGTWPHASRMRA
jgi:hypothetical protein